MNFVNNDIYTKKDGYLPSLLFHRVHLKHLKLQIECLYWLLASLTLFIQLLCKVLYIEVVHIFYLSHNNDIIF